MIITCLESLPVEVLERIAEFCDYHTCASWRQSSKIFLSKLSRFICLSKVLHIEQAMNGTTKTIQTNVLYIENNNNNKVFTLRESLPNITHVICEGFPVDLRFLCLLRNIRILVFRDPFGKDTFMSPIAFHTFAKLLFLRLPRFKIHVYFDCPFPISTFNTDEFYKLPANLSQPNLIIYAQLQFDEFQLTQSLNDWIEFANIYCLQKSIVFTSDAHVESLLTFNPSVMEKCKQIVLEGCDIRRVFYWMYKSRRLFHYCSNVVIRCKFSELASNLRNLRWIPVECKTTFVVGGNANGIDIPIRPMHIVPTTLYGLQVKSGCNQMFTFKQWNALISWFYAISTVELDTFPVLNECCMLESIEVPSMRIRKSPRELSKVVLNVCGSGGMEKLTVEGVENVAPEEITLSLLIASKNGCDLRFD